jgi:hypothetical protein
MYSGRLKFCAPQKYCLRHFRRDFEALPDELKILLIDFVLVYISKKQKCNFWGFFSPFYVAAGKQFLAL